MKKKRVFAVTIYFIDHSRTTYNILARDDLEARQRAIDMDLKSWDKSERVPDVDFCETRFCIELDAAVEHKLPVGRKGERLTEDEL